MNLDIRKFLGVDVGHGGLRRVRGDIGGGLRAGQKVREIVHRFDVRPRDHLFGNDKAMLQFQMQEQVQQQN